MRKIKMIKIIAIMCICTVLCFSFSLSAGAEALNWYIKRNSEHKQPRADVNMEFVEQYGGYYVDKRHGDDDSDKVVYLTFDAGYENGNVEKILDVLRNEQVKGAFFILENLITRNRELVTRMAEEGHTLCNHTCRHRDMTKVGSVDEFGEELARLEQICLENTGYSMSKYYRPPEGRFDKTSLIYANELGYKTIFWSLAYADWDNNKQPSASSALEKLNSNIHNGAVILLHPTSATNALILSDFIRGLKSEGYRFGTLDELCAE